MTDSIVKESTAIPAVNLQFMCLNADSLDIQMNDEDYKADLDTLGIYALQQADLSTLFAEELNKWKETYQKLNEELKCSFIEIKLLKEERDEANNERYQYMINHKDKVVEENISEMNAVNKQKEALMAKCLKEKEDLKMTQIEYDFLKKQHNVLDNQITEKLEGMEKKMKAIMDIEAKICNLNTRVSMTEKPIKHRSVIYGSAVKHPI